MGCLEGRRTSIKHIKRKVYSINYLSNRATATLAFQHTGFIPKQFYQQQQQPKHSQNHQHQHQTLQTPPKYSKKGMSAYFLHQPSKATLKLHPSTTTTTSMDKSTPSTTTSKESTPRASTSTSTFSTSSTMKEPIVSETPVETKKEKMKSTTKKVLQSIKKGWKEHHESVQGAYEAYYGMGTQTGRALGNPHKKV